MIEGLKQNPLAAACQAESTPVDAEERARRDSLVTELQQLIAAAQEGRILAMIVVEEVANTFPRQASTALYGEREMIVTAAFQVIAKYDASAEEEPGLIVPDRPALIVPGGR